jgi:Tfp pilus assembly protein PilF
MNPRNPIATFNLGLVQRKSGDLVSAQETFRRALELDPDFPEPAIELAALRGQAHQYSDAINLLKPVVARHPEMREARLSLAKTYIQVNDPDLALATIGAPPSEDALALCLAGAAHLQKEKLDEAQTFLEAALRRDRSLVDARINLAQIYLRKGDHARAARYMQAAKVANIQ